MFPCMCPPLSSQDGRLKHPPSFAAMSYVSDWRAPGKLVASLGAPFWGNLKPTAGDFACLCSLFFDNLSTMLTFSSIWQAPPFTAHESLPPPIPTLHDDFALSGPKP